MDMCTLGSRSSLRTVTNAGWNAMGCGLRHTSDGCDTKASHGAPRGHSTRPWLTELAPARALLFMLALHRAVTPYSRAICCETYTSVGHLHIQ
eukprot:scaffold126205_cov36-Tisochrysis_lutea.AAC.5